MIIIQDFMNNTVLKIVFAGLLITTMFSCKHKADSNTLEGTVSSQDSISYAEAESDVKTGVAPQITKINKSPNRLTKEVNTYTVTLITEGKKVRLEDTEFSLDGKEWQQSAEFKNVTCGKYTFYARNRQNKSLQDKKQMHFECFVDIPLPTIPQLNKLLKQMADCDDKASDELRKYGKNLPVRGVANVGDVEQLIRDACMNGIVYTVQKIETDKSGNLEAIIIIKN